MFLEGLKKNKKFCILVINFVVLCERFEMFYFIII